MSKTLSKTSISILFHILRTNQSLYQFKFDNLHAKCETSMSDKTNRIRSIQFHYSYLGIYKVSKPCDGDIENEFILSQSVNWFSIFPSHGFDT